MNKPLLSASILSADFAHLADDVNAVLRCGMDYIHFDVMDHHFVPNLTFGAGICSALRKAGITAPIDVHLMVDQPGAYVEPFAAAGASLLTFHPETVSDVEALVDKISAHRMGVGLVYNPDKPVEISETIARKLQMILLMSVYPGFGGQSFIPSVLEKAQQVRQWMDKLQLQAYLAIDGGIKVDNIAAAASAGCDYFVIGSGLFSAQDYAQRVAEFRKGVSKGT